MGLVFSLGACLIGLGGYQLLRLDNTHQRSEILHSVSPRTLQAWLLSLDDAHPETVALLADRFNHLTLPQRRDAVLAIARPEFFEAMALDFSQRRILQSTILNAVQQVLAKTPALGDMWLLSANLHSKLFGFDATVQRHLELSFTYAPREVDLVLERLQIMSLAWPLLNARSRDIVLSDVRVIDAVFPERSGELRQYLQQAGAELDDNG